MKGRVVLTNHAAIRAVGRDISRDYDQVCADVLEAIDAGRVAKTLPRWAQAHEWTRGRGKAYQAGKKGAGGKVRYCWPEHQRFLFVISQRCDRGDRHRPVILVLTVMLARHGRPEPGLAEFA